MINWKLSKHGNPLTSTTWPYRGLKCRPIEVEYFLKLSADKLPLSNDRRLKFIFSKDSYQICCVCVTMAPHYQDFDFKLASEAKIQPVFLKVQAGKTLSYHGHALVTLYVQFLYSDRSKFDRWVHADKLCSILKVVNFDGWSWQSFVSTWDVLTVFFLWMYKMKYRCYQGSSVIHGWFVYWVFGWEMRRLSKFGNSFLDGIVFVFDLA